jgi:hypothetical protein
MSIIERLMTEQDRPALRSTVLDAFEAGVPDHLVRRLTGLGRFALAWLLVVG